MLKTIDQLPAVLTSYAYRNEYFPELAAMVPSVRQHHPDWPIVIGRGPVNGFGETTLEVETPSGKCHWSLPISLNLEQTREASERDWSKVCFMKGWWVAEVWRNLAKFTKTSHNRLIWLDADARLNGPLDIELDPEAELVAGAWWAPPGCEYSICSGLLVFQGALGGIVDSLIAQWSQACLECIEHLPPDPLPNQPNIARASDQTVLTRLLQSACASNPHMFFMKLDVDKYCGMPDLSTGGEAIPGALVDQWMMNEKMRLPEDRGRDWPPPEEARRQRNEKADSRIIPQSRLPMLSDDCEDTKPLA